MQLRRGYLDGSGHESPRAMENDCSAGPSDVPNYFQVTALAHAEATFSQYLTADRINAARLLRVLFQASNLEFLLHLSNEHLAERTIRFEAICQN
jgi:hypothetical protein